MCRIMEELKEETAAKVTQQVTQQVTAKVTKQVTAKVTKQVTAENSRKIALRLLQSGEKSLEKIALLTDLPLSEVKKLAEQK